MTSDQIRELRELHAKRPHGVGPTVTNDPYVIAILDAAPALLDAAEEAIRLREGNIAMLGALEVVKREVECYCTHEGINAGKNGYPCAHCMAVAVLTRADKRGWGTLVADNALLKETLQLRKELEQVKLYLDSTKKGGDNLLNKERDENKRLRELVKAIQRALERIVELGNSWEPGHRATHMQDEASNALALALASKEVAS